MCVLKMIEGLFVSRWRIQSRARARWCVGGGGEGEHEAKRVIISAFTSTKCRLRVPMAVNIARSTHACHDCDDGREAFPGVRWPQRRADIADAS